MNLIITGANGWLGKNLCALIENTTNTYNKVIKTDLSSTASKKGFIFGNLSSIEFCDELLSKSSGADVVHLAGLIHPKKISDFYVSNVQTTKNVLESCLKHGIRRVVLISSNSPFGTNKKIDTFDENSCFNPYMNYGIAKMQSELLCREYRNKGLDVVILRGTWFYGPFQPARQTLFFKMVKNGKAPLVGKGDNLRSMTSTVALSQVIYQTLVSENSRNQDYWIADKHPYSMKHVIDTIRSVLTEDFNIACKPGYLNLPAFTSQIAYSVDYATQALGLYFQKVHVLSEMNKNIACRVDKAENELNYCAPHSLKPGISESIKWCLDNNIKI